MLEIYRTENVNLHRKVEILIERKLGKTFEINRTDNGKPYIDGNPLYFSLSHSQDNAVIALCDKPVGVDFERGCKDGGLKNFTHILSRFTGCERQWIDGAPALFFLNWVAKESYIKMVGGTLAHHLKRLEFYDYNLYLDGLKVDCGLSVGGDFKAGFYAVCAEDYPDDMLSGCSIKQFRLKKGERI